MNKGKKKLLEEKKLKQEEILRKQQESKEKKLKKKMLEERWAMARWLTAYIDQNHEKWTREALENQKTENQRAAEWHRMERFEKIRIIREKQEENRPQ